MLCFCVHQEISRPPSTLTVIQGSGWVLSPVPFSFSTLPALVPWSLSPVVQGFHSSSVPASLATHTLVSLEMAPLPSLCFTLFSLQAEFPNARFLRFRLSALGSADTASRILAGPPVPPPHLSIFQCLPIVIVYFLRSHHTLRPCSPWSASSILHRLLYHQSPLLPARHWSPTETFPPSCQSVHYRLPAPILPRLLHPSILSSSPGPRTFALILCLPSHLLSSLTPAHLWLPKLILLPSPPSPLSSHSRSCGPLRTSAIH